MEIDRIYELKVKLGKGAFVQYFWASTILQEIKSKRI